MSFKKVIRAMDGERELICKYVDSFCSEEADDGGAGSGNWGHKGRPGKRGGSGKGGGSQNRQEKEGGGYERKKLSPSEAVAKYSSSGSSGLKRSASGNAFTPGQKQTSSAASNGAGKPAKTAANPHKASTNAIRNIMRSASGDKTPNDEYKSLNKVVGEFNNIPDGSVVKTKYGTFVVNRNQGTVSGWSFTSPDGSQPYADTYVASAIMNSPINSVEVSEGTSKAATSQQTEQPKKSALESLKYTQYGHTGSVAGSGDVELVTKTMQNLVDNHKGAVLMNDRGEAFYVGENGLIHSSEGYDIDPKSKEDMQDIADGSYLLGVSSEGSFDKEATKKLADDVITKSQGGEAFKKLPNGTKVMLGGSLWQKTGDDDWQEVGHSSPWGTDSNDMAGMLEGMSLPGYNTGAALEKNGFQVSPMGYGAGGYLVTPFGIVSDKPVNGQASSAPKEYKPSKGGGEILFTDPTIKRGQTRLHAQKVDELVGGETKLGEVNGYTIYQKPRSMTNNFFNQFNYVAIKNQKGSKK